MTRLAALIVALILPLPAPAQEATPLTPEEHAEWTAIGRVNVGGLNTRSTCTGTLIAPDLVLTAAHCVPPRTRRSVAPEIVHFVAGWYRDGFAAHRTAAEIHVHPDYSWESRSDRLHADVALLVLDEPIPEAEVRPLPLGPMPNFADDVEIIAYSNRRPGALERAGPCTGLALSSGLLGLTCEVRGGNSGAPLLRPDGDGWTVVAVTVAKAGSGAFHSYAVAAAAEVFELAGREMP